MTKKVKITADCVCDLPENILQDYDIPVIYFYVNTESGSFRDKTEITARNIMEYFASGAKKISTAAPSVAEYRDFFADAMVGYDEIVHISITAKMSSGYVYAKEAAKEFGGKVHVFDTEHLSAGMGLLALKASDLAAEGADANCIMEALQGWKTKTNTTFIVENTKNLYYAGRVSKTRDTIFSGLKIRPILRMKEGELKLDGITMGNFEKCVYRYIKRQLKNPAEIDKSRVFVTHCSCPVKVVNLAKKVAQQYCEFRELDVSNASATISGNCGANTIGVIFMQQ